MINLDDVTKENKKCNLNWPQIPDYPYRILRIEGSGNGKRNPLFDPMSLQPDIDKTHLCTKISSFN